MRRLIAIVAVLVVSWASSTRVSNAGSSEGHGAIRARDGLIVVWNESSAHFTLKLRGKKFREAKMEGLAVFMDEFLVQLIAVDPTEFAPRDSTPQEILTRHMAFEGDHWSRTVGAPMPTGVKATETPLPSGMQMWEIRWSPEAREKAKSVMVKNLFLTAVIGDRLLSVSHPVKEGEDEAAAYAYLESVARSVERQETAIDVGEVQKRARGE